MTFENFVNSDGALDAAASFRFLADHIHDHAIYLLDADGMVAQWSRSAERLKGYAAAEVVGRHYALFYDADAVAAGVPARLLQTAREEGRVEDEGWRVRRDGSRFWANVIITALRDEAGNVHGFAKVTRDLTARRRREEALRSSSDIGTQVIGSVHEGITVLDRNLRYQIWNPFLEHLTGLPRDRVLGRHVLEVFPTLEGDACCEFFNAALEGQYSGKQVSRLPAECARDAWIACEYIPLLAPDGAVTGVIVAVRDITDRIEQQAKIDRLTRISAVLSSINGAIVRIRDRDLLLQEACRIAVTHGAFLSAWIGLLDDGGLDGHVVAATGSRRDYFERVYLTLREDVPASTRPANIAMRTGLPFIGNDVRTVPGLADVCDELLGKHHLSMAAFPLIVEDRVVGAFSLFADTVGFFDEPEVKLLNELAGDISFGLEYIQKDQRLNYLSYYDPVTALPNRGFFTEQLGKKLAAADRGMHQMAVSVGDVRRLGQVNDTFGRKCGDELLRQIGQRFLGTARNPESIAYLGNGRFASTVDDIAGAADVARSIERTRQIAASQPFVLDGEKLHIKTTIGVAIYPHDGVTAEALLRHAEAALAQAKQLGAPYLFYDASVNAQVADALRLESRLRRALDEGEFVLHYQPKVRTTDRALVGLEALLRWNDPENGLVYPDGFIPALEKTGMIVEAGLWVIEQALRDFHDCHAAGIDLPRIAVNVSVKQLQDARFLDDLRDLAHCNRGIGQALELEITESVVMDNIGEHIAMLAAIKDMGIHVAIDDFGTGYSSLSYLAKLPIDALKIDRSFVQSMTDDPANMAIVASIISLAHALKLDVIAEGVETEEQAERLAQMACDELQGYLFSRPVPLADIIEGVPSKRAPMRP